MLLLRYLAFVVAFVAAFVWPALASASMDASPEARVGGFEVADRTELVRVVGVDVVESSGETWLTFHAGPLNTPVARVRKSDLRVFYLVQGKDRSVRAVFDEEGSLVETYEYSAFGETALRTHGGHAESGNRLAFHGQRWSSDVGLYDMRARAYAPRWGRFLTPDPSGAAGGANLYAFAGNNPVDFWDPFGLVAQNQGPVTRGVIPQYTARPYAATKAAELLDYVGSYGRDDLRSHVVGMLLAVPAGVLMSIGWGEGIVIGVLNLPSDAELAGVNASRGEWDAAAGYTGRAGLNALVIAGPATRVVAAAGTEARVVLQGLRELADHLTIHFAA